MPGGGSVSVVRDGSAVGRVGGDECGKAYVGRVGGGSHVSVVLAFGGVDLVSGGSRVGLVEGAGGAVATVGVVDVDSRVWACWVSMLAWGSLWGRIVCLTRRMLRGFLVPGCVVRVATVTVVACCV